MKKIILKSPAKVNLHLRIVGRRPNGYHNLVSVFHRLSLADTLTLSKRKADFSFSSNVNLPTREGNLLFKAYVELKKKFPKLGGVQVGLVKRIPIGAGLGGGSSNAAFFLLGMKNIIILFLLLSQNLFSQTNFFQTGAKWGYHTNEKGDTHWDKHLDWIDQITITLLRRTCSPL